jgi:hypothetical protein
LDDATLTGRAGAKLKLPPFAPVFERAHVPLKENVFAVSRKLVARA